MHEIVQKILEEVEGAWRFRWYALVAAWAVAITGWIVVMVIPNVYEARARVYVDTMTALKPLLKGLAPESDVESKLDMVRQALLSQPHLERVARDADLDLRAKTREQKEALLAGLANQITITMDSSGRQRDRQMTDAMYVITFRNGDRTKALHVVQTLLDTFMADTLGSKRSGSESAQQFLQQQLQAYAARLSEAESRLAEFKKKNVGLMPSQSGDYFQRVQAETEALNKARSALRQATARRDTISAQLSGEKPFVAGTAAPAGMGGPAQNDIDTRIRETQAKLDELLLRFTEKHPEVIAARNTLAELQKRRDQELAALARGEPGSGLAAREANPVYQSLQLQLNEAQVQVAANQSEMADRQRNLAELNSRLSVAPEVEAELARLNRDYGVTKTEYEALLERLESAKLSEQADQTGIVKFTVIDPPAAPLIPVAPNRKLLVLLAFAAALAAGAALAYGLHRLRLVFTNPRTLADVTGLRVLGSVSLINRPNALAQARREYRMLAGATLALVAACALVLLIEGGKFGFVRQWFA